jgi:hypothetical protein
VVRCDLADGGAALAMVEVSPRGSTTGARWSTRPRCSARRVAALDVGTNWEALQVNAATRR